MTALPGTLRGPIHSGGRARGRAIMGRFCALVAALPGWGGLAGGYGPWLGGLLAGIGLLPVGRGPAGLAAGAISHFWT
ncbi:hypothetical protein [Rhodovulum sulfidophilum]|uniref:hypothetical protein n=1 Tax=Rhodovulum sulfidophilum TaxID=35806 RepID=UPI0009525C1C|nr:hypothetical protein [Rhodovulum sulfidophilum]OLS52141.1 hypothetical protein BV392_09135 [Rhodovulum sulfidophilum]